MERSHLVVASHGGRQELVMNLVVPLQISSAELHVGEFCNAFPFFFAFMALGRRTGKDLQLLVFKSRGKKELVQRRPLRRLLSTAVFPNAGCFAPGLPLAREATPRSGFCSRSRACSSSLRGSSMTSVQGSTTATPLVATSPAASPAPEPGDQPDAVVSFL